MMQTTPEKITGKDIVKDIPGSEVGKIQTVVERDIKEYLSKNLEASKELSDKSQEFIFQFLRYEESQLLDKYIDTWLQENQEYIKNTQRIDIAKITDKETRRQIFLENQERALEDLKSNDAYKEYYERIQNIVALKERFSSGNASVVEYLIVLYKLNKKKEELEKEINALHKKGTDPEILKHKKDQLSQIQSVEMELAKKFLGEDVEQKEREEAEKSVWEELVRKDKNEYKTGALASLPINQSDIDSYKERQISEKLKREKENIIKNKAEELGKARGSQQNVDVVKEYTEILQQFGIDTNDPRVKDIVVALISNNIDPNTFKKVGIFRKKIKTQDGRKLSPEDFKKFIEDVTNDTLNKLSALATKEFEDEIEKEISKRTYERIDRRIKELVGGEDEIKKEEEIKKMYQFVRGKIIKEGTEIIIRKKDRKSAKQFEDVQKKVNIVEMLRTIIERTDELEEMPYRYNKQALDNLSNLIENRLIENRTGESIDKINKDILDAIIDPQEYNEAVRKEYGFLKFILDIVDKYFKLSPELLKIQEELKKEFGNISTEKEVSTDNLFKMLKVKLEGIVNLQERDEKMIKGKIEEILKNKNQREAFLENEDAFSSGMIKILVEVIKNRM